MNSILMDVLRGKTTSRPPVWMMRQAGRVLPRYRALRESYTFHELMQDPDLCAQVTLMPVEDLGVDAAILFSDILVIPVAMGASLEWSDHGPVFTNPLAQYDTPSKLIHPDPSRLEYIYHAIDRIIAQRKPDTPLIGFCGAPLTVLCYLLQGVSSKHDFPQAVKFFYSHPQETRRLVDQVVEMTIDYALHQVTHGVDAFQIFESHAGLLPEEMYRELFLPAVARIGRALKEKNVPVIFFPKGIGHNLKYITPDICDFISVDWQTDIVEARRQTDPNIGLQGNMDPRIFYAPKEVIQAKLESYIPFFAANPNWIFNLGHGVLADTPVEQLKWTVEWIKNTNWSHDKI